MFHTAVQPHRVDRFFPCSSSSSFSRSFRELIGTAGKLCILLIIQRADRSCRADVSVCLRSLLNTEPTRYRWTTPSLSEEILSFLLHGRHQQRIVSSAPEISNSLFFPSPMADVSSSQSSHSATTSRLILSFSPTQAHLLLNIQYRENVTIQPQYSDR